MIDVLKLAEPFPQEAVHWRVQGKPYERNGIYSAMALAYIDARDVMDRLDEVCGPENWQAEYTETASGRVICRIGIYCADAWVWKADGAGSTAVEGEKGGISDALKRAAVAWGIGRYLYRLDTPWVRCNVNKKGDNVYWKSWSENPWNKVKQTNFVAPQPIETPSAPKDESAPSMPPLPTVLKDIADADSLDRLRIIYSHTKPAYGEDPQWDQAMTKRRIELTTQKEQAA